MRRLSLALLAASVLSFTSTASAVSGRDTPQGGGPPAADGLASLPVLRPGEVVTGVIEQSDPRIESESLTSAAYASFVVRGKSYRIEVERPGPYTIELRSHFFDSYLVLRDRAGLVLAEADDGLIRMHARLTLPVVAAGEVMQVDACALHHGIGAFELRLLEGVPVVLSPAAKRAAQVDDAREAVEVVGGMLGKDHPDTATSLNGLAELFLAQGDYEAARPLFERALSIRETTLGKDHPDTATSLNNLAALLHYQGDYEAARPLYERALSIREITPGKDHPQTASTLGNLAVLLQAQGDFEAARPLCERVLSINETTYGKDHPDTARSLGNLAVLLQAQGDYEAARPLYERALSIHESTLGKDHPQTAGCLNNLAALLHYQGDYGAARPLYERALSIRETTLGKDHPDTATSLSNLAVLLQVQGDYEAARPLYERALSIRESTLGKDHRDTATTLGNLAALLRDQGDDEAARPLYERALSIRESMLGKDHPDTAMSLSNLAVLYQGDYEAARPLYERALSIYETTLGKDHPKTVVTLSNLAVLLQAQGDYEAARPLLERALSIRESTLGQEHPDTARSLNYLAVLLLDMGETVKSLALSRRAMDVQQAHRKRLAWSLTEAERLLLARTQRLTLELFLGMPETAARSEGVSPYETLLAWKGQVLRSLMQTRGSMMATLGGADGERVERLQQLQARLSKELFKKDIDNRDGHQELLASLREERNTLEVALARSIGKADESHTPSVAELRSALPAESVLLDFFIHKVYEPARRDADGKRVAAGHWTAPRLSAWVLRPGTDTVRHVDLGDAAPIEAATSAFLGELVARRGITAIGGEDPGDAAAGAPSDANERLRTLLWEPLRQMVGKAHQVFVSPDGFLGTLPLETLQLADASFLLEHHAFVYGEDMASLVDLVASRRPAMQTDATESSSDLFCVGNVDYRKCADLAWRKAPVHEREDDVLLPHASAIAAVAASPPHTSSMHALARGGFSRRWTSLPATDEEARAISEIHEENFEEEGTRLSLRGREATEERLKYELPRHDIVHLATHGFFQPEGLPSMWRQVMDDDGKRQMEMFEEQGKIVGLMPGLMSGLVLAGANRKPDTDRDDGFLTAEEISLLDLSGVKLVVLSACETALGKSEAGEGMLGLRRTFRQSGARAVISSLWKVSDEATSQLMQGFYERMWLDGDGTLDALRGAQLDMLKQSRIENDGAGMPSTWGAFVLDGDWR